MHARWPTLLRRRLTGTGATAIDVGINEIGVVDENQRADIEGDGPSMGRSPITS